MKLVVAAATAAGALCAASAANADCTVVTNHVVIANRGVFREAGVPFDLQLRARWRVADSTSGFLDVGKGDSLTREYPGDYPLVVDFQYSDKLRGWRAGETVDVVGTVASRLRAACPPASNTKFIALTVLTAATATTDGLDVDVEVDFQPVH